MLDRPSAIMSYRELEKSCGNVTFQVHEEGMADMHT